MSSDKSSLPLETIGIDGFRGVRGLELKDLERINFLVGTGNSGKTSILEAIACYAHPLDIREWLRVARFREARENRFYPLQAPDVLRWLFPHSISASGDDLHGKLHVEAEGASPIASMAATCSPFSGITRSEAPDPQDEEDEDSDPGGTLVEQDGWRFALEARMRGSQAVETLEFIAWSETVATIPIARGPQLTCQLLAPYAHRNQPAQLKGLTRATMENDKSGVVELLGDLDPMIVGVEIIADGARGNAQLALRHRLSGLAPIHVFGDGLRRALMIALAIVQCRGGVLLLDEIEAALHVSALGKVFPWLERACREYDVQLVGTTHSLEAIDAVAGCIESRSVAAFHIDGGTGRAKRYSRDMLLRLVHERGLDIR